MRMNITLNKYLNDLIGASIFLYYFTLIFLSQVISGGRGRYLLLGSLLIMLGCTLIKRPDYFKLQLPLYITYIALFTLYTFLSSAWALDASWPIYWGRDFLVMMIMMTILIHCLPKKKTIDLLLRTVMYSGYAAIVCSVLIYGWSYFVSVLSDSDRIENDLLNANILGLTAAYSILINFYFVVNHRKTLYCIPLTALAFVVLAASGSRKALLFLVLGVCLVAVLRNFNSKQAFVTIIKIAALVIVLFIAFYFILKLPIMSGISKRMEGLINIVSGEGKADSSTLGRMRLIRLGKKIFASSPIIGIGIDNSKIIALQEIHRKDFYLHNNYIEILADGGIIGFIVYYWFYFYLGYMLIKYRNFQDQEYNLCVILFLLNLAMDVGMVSYLYKSTYFHLLIIYSKVMVLRKRHKRKLYDGILERIK